MILAELLTLKRSDDAALVAQLTQQLRALMASGRIRSGAVLPSSRSLSAELDVSRNTVTHAYEQLAAEGYLSVAARRRPVVADDIQQRFAKAAPAPKRAPKSETRRDAVRKPVLSPWAAKLSETDWPLSYQAEFRPLRPGLADAREFPHQIWARCLRRSALRRRFNDQTVVNRPSLREALRDYLEINRGVHAEAEQILILPAAQAALTLIAASTVVPNDTVWTEDPGYPGAAAAFRAAGADVVGVRLDRWGMTRVGETQPPKLIFATPSHQHPTGRVMPVARRSELLAVAEPGKTWIVEDDYDGEFHYDSRPMPALQGLDREGCVLYLGTFAKAMTADIRIGYLVVPSQLAKTMEIAQRHLGLVASVHVQEALADFMTDGHFLAHLRRMRRLYRSRRDHLAAALARHLGGVLAPEIPPGGMQLVARFKDGASDRNAVTRLVAAGVEVRALSSLALERPRDVGLLLGFAAWRENEIGAAVRIMANCLTTKRAARG
ncbi:PLP-dependent aminotransferase family protein [Bradyrhizobium genosp. L]|uniref:MocR-like pyridoxine biosynthesis transcription factor PdxR n=1 Tax=Bradyrhizobium genosp. L TaxID=83637 RepID=UPI0018A2E441|nr:PLP-dependent aminotransferase family protein [Bradyrhizobium genosp. L]QPF86773.1 PLP-dependent aminotransferase family protein [Bradyrhizobium genosp. L]